MTKSLIPAMAVLLMVAGCATVSMLPQNVADVNYDTPEGKTGWSQYQQVQDFTNTDIDQIYDAAKIGLGAAGFSLRSADKAKGYAIGEHGITLHDWNIVAGVYFKQVGTTVKVKVIAEGSKDTGVSGDVTGDAWCSKILIGMQEHLNATNQAVLKVDKKDLK